MSPDLTGLFLTSSVIVFAAMILFIKKRMPACEHWTKVYVGLGLILGGRLFGLLDTLGIYLPPVFAGPNRVVIEGVIGYLGGTVFLMAGFIDVIPVFKKALSGTEDKNEIRQRLLYDAANSLIFPGCDLRKATTSLLSYICHNFKFKSINIHIIPSTGGVLRHYSGVSTRYDDRWLKRDFPIRDSVIGRAMLERKAHRSDLSEIPTRLKSGIGNGRKLTFTGFPIITGVKSWGVISIVADAAFREPEMLERYIKYCAERIGTCFDHEKEIRENRTKSNYLKLHLSVIEILNRWSELEVSLPKIADKLGEHIDFDYLHLARLDESGYNMWHFIYSHPGKSLIEKGASISLEPHLLGRIILNRRPEVFPYTPTEDNPHKIYSKNQTLQCMGVPIFMDQRLVGALLLTSEKERHYDTAALNILRFITPVMAKYLSGINLKDKYYNREKRLSSLAGAVGVINDPRSLQDSLREAARILTTFLPVTSCRIMLLEKGNELLRTVGLYQKRSLDWEESSLGLVSAQSAPVHQKSIIEKRPVVIDFNQPSPAMKPKEKAMLFYSNVSAALVVPVFYGETPLGLISLGEMRSYKRWSPTSDDLNFAVAVASRMGLALEVYQLRHRLTEMEEMKPVRPGAASGEDWNRIRNEIMNSLTGIMGSSELISATCSDNMDSRMIKYLEVIQRSGQRIGTLLNRYRVPDRRRTNPAQERINRVSLPGQGRLDNYLINQ